MRTISSEEIHILVDPSIKMHVKIDDDKTAMEKVNEFLLHLCKKIDSQPAYSNLLHIHIGDDYIELKEGKAEKSIKDAHDLIFKVGNQTDYLSLWKTALDASEGPSVTTFFIFSSVIVEDVLTSFTSYGDMLLFMDFSGKDLGLNPRVKGLSQVVKTSGVKRMADKMHNNFMGHFMTTVDFGLPSFKAEFDIVRDKDDLELDLKEIRIIGSTTSQQLEYITVLAKSFLYPINQCYDNENAPISNTTAYYMLKEILGEKPEYTEADSSKDESKDESNDSTKDDSKEESLKEANEELKKEEGTVKTEVDDGTEHHSEEVKEAVETEPEDAKNEVTPKPKRRQASARGRGVHAGCDNDDEDDDEEYTPIKKRGRKNAKSPGRGGKRKPATPRKATRSSVRGKEPKEEVKKEVEKEKTPEEVAPENNEGETKASEKKGVNIFGETSTEESEPMYLVACGVQRFTNLARPVILRLRRYNQQDKTYYDAETLQKKIEEEAEKKAQEEKERLERAQLDADSPASPMHEDQGPASPDCMPSTSQNVKMIPTIPTIPTVIPTIPLDQAPKDTDMRAPESPKDVDYRLMNVKPIPVEPVVGKSDVEPMEVGTEPATSDEAENGEKKVTCIKETQDDPQEPDEPNEDDVVTNDQAPVKSIPVESEAEKSESKLHIDENEAEKTNDSLEKTTFIEVIVLDVEWDLFKKQVALDGDDEAADLIAEREKTVVGPEPSHDYSKLTGWYTSEAMSFYVNKMTRALRKLHERSAIFENEYENMVRMVLFSQNPELAQQFAMLIRDEAYGLPRNAVPFAEGSASYFDQLRHQILYPIAR